MFCNTLDNRNEYFLFYQLLSPHQPVKIYKEACSTRQEHVVSLNKQRACIKSADALANNRDILSARNSCKNCSSLHLFTSHKTILGSMIHGVGGYGFFIPGDETRIRADYSWLDRLTEDTSCSERDINPPVFLTY
ncbi:hypothetical protein J6590_049596 [Homalodisca vitripennis]|nr:hypothetical protein J6590_049596 [Homalodisca vitripennis]